MEARRLQPEDAPLAFQAIRAIKQPAPQPTFSIEYLQRFLSRPENVLIVASNDNEPIGFLLAYLLDRIDRDQPMVCLYEIGVAEDHQRRGIGSAMISALKQICGHINAMEAWVITNRSNAAAVRLYESTGAKADTSGDEVGFVYGAENWNGDSTTVS